MITNRHPVRGISILAVVAVCAAGGCLPIPYTVIQSPPIVGQLQRSNGSPIAGTRVILSGVYGDSTCTDAAAYTTTDSAGNFELPVTTRRMPYIVLGPHTYGSHFQVCIESAGTLSRAYEGDTYPSRPPYRGATLVLSCVAAPEPEPQNGARVSCAH